jgi:tetratricopeptide (TPR) repeat protein
MRLAETRVRAAVGAGTDFRQKEPDLFYLGGISRPWGLVVDSASGDWILFGEQDAKGAVLTLDDWVTALRARIVQSKDPGVTIDPRGGPNAAAVQDVRFFGGVENTHFGQVCFEADWLMKRIGLGLEHVPVVGLQTYYDLSVAEARQGGGQGTSVGSRFWFYPIVSRVDVLDDMVLLEKQQMGVFTEILSAEVNGKAVADLTTLQHAPSDGFARSMSEHYDELAEARNELKTLRGLSLLDATAKGLTALDRAPETGYLVRDYPREDVKTPTEVEVLKATSNEGGGFRISGGVSLTTLAMRLKGGDAGALRELLLAARQTPEQLVWGFDMEVADGVPVAVKLPAELGDPTGVAALFSQALFLQQQKRYDAAIEGYSRALTVDPHSVGTLVNRGATYDEQGKHDQAIADYDAALAIAPRSVEALSNRGLAYRETGQHDRAIADFDAALAINPSDAEVLTNRGAAYYDSGQSDRAISDYDVALAINPRLVGALNNRGLAYSGERDYDRAIADFDAALAIDLRYAQALNNRGLAHSGKRDYDRAIADFDVALAIDPSSAAALGNRGSAYVLKGQYDRAIADFDAALAIAPRLAGRVLNNRALAWFLNRDYDRAWADVRRCREAGGDPSPNLVRDLERASGRRE